VWLTADARPCPLGAPSPHLGVMPLSYGGDRCRFPPPDRLVGRGKLRCTARQTPNLLILRLTRRAALRSVRSASSCRPISATATHKASPIARELVPMPARTLRGSARSERVKLTRSGSRSLRAATSLISARIA